MALTAGLGNEAPLVAVRPQSLWFLNIPDIVSSASHPCEGWRGVEIGGVPCMSPCHLEDRSIWIQSLDRRW